MSNNKSRQLRGLNRNQGRTVKRRIERVQVEHSIRRTRYLEEGKHKVKVTKAVIKETKNGTLQLVIYVVCVETGALGTYAIPLNLPYPNSVLNQLLDALDIEDGCEPEDLVDEEIVIEVKFKDKFYNIQSIESTDSVSISEEELEEDEYEDDVLEDDELEDYEDDVLEDDELEDYEDELEDDELEDYDDELED